VTAHDIEAPADDKIGTSGLQQSNSHANRRSAELGSTIHFGILALMLAVTMPRLVRSFSPSLDTLDTSWAWMMGYALQHHLQWGKSIVFTYGPLGFLTHSYFYPDHALWALAATIRLITWFGFGLGLACILRRLVLDDRPFARTTVPVALAWCIGARFLHLSAQSAVIGVLLLVLALAEEDSSALAVELMLAGALLALGSLIKATALIVSLFVLLVYPALWRHAGNRKSAQHLSLLPLLSFIISFCALWSISSQSFANLPAYIRGTWEIVKGYTPAMSVTGMPLQIVAALLILSLLAAALVGLYAAGRRVRVAQCLLLAGVAFWAWKEGFTLQDWGYFRHPMTFYGIALIIAGAGTVMLSKEKSRYLTVCVYSAYALALGFSIPGYPTLSLIYTNVLDNYEHYFVLISSESRRAEEQSGQTAAIRQQFQVRNAALNAVGHASVNVIPWWLMMAQGYHMRLVSSPIIQAYSAYTPYLDRMNARQMWDGRSADKIIYTYLVFDDRYPPFNEPATFRALLDCYRTEYPGAPYAVLSHIPCAPTEMAAVADDAGRGTFGKWIVVPLHASYAGIGVHTTLVGHVASILFKPGYVRIFLKLAGGSVKGPYRFIYPVGEDGLFVRYFIGSHSDAVRLFAGDTSGLQRIAAIKIITDRPSLDYAKHFEIRFFDENRSQRPQPVIKADRRTTAGTRDERRRA
jgi:hypothetical protein